MDSGLSSCPRLNPRLKAFPRKRRKHAQSHNEDREEGDFNCEAFMDVSIEVISQFFE